MSQVPIVINGKKITDPYLLQLAPLMDIERATFVRRLRVSENYTYRAVAQTCADEWATEAGDSQIVGMNLCALAAEYFNEDWGKEPWA